MADTQKLVLMVQPNRLQGAIWHAVLKSQQITVIWEAADANLLESFSQLKQAGLSLPDVLLLDTQVPDLNPLMFCRWCREFHPDIQVVLTDHTQQTIPSHERRWAMYQGAADFLPGFQRQDFVSSVAEAVKRVLELLDNHPLNNGALISVLLAVKRHLEARASQKVSNKSATSTGATSNGKPPNGKSANGKLANANGKVGNAPNQGGLAAGRSNGLMPSAHAPWANHTAPVPAPIATLEPPLSNLNSSEPAALAQNPLPEKERPTPKLVSPDIAAPSPTIVPEPNLDEPPPVRRYRGRIY